MKETTLTKSYDFTEANDFLLGEAQTTPEELYNEVLTAMTNVASIENKRNRKVTESVWETLLTCADYFRTLAGKEVAL